MWQAQPGPSRRGRSFAASLKFARLDGMLAAHVIVELLGLGGKPWALQRD
jgi:hypothetical protein